MIEYFKDLTPDELYKFEKFVYSPYFSTQKNLVRLFLYLKKLHPDISASDLKKEKISENVYHEKTVNEVKIRKLLSEFSLFMDKFFVQLEIEHDDIRNRILLLSSLRKRGIKKRFEMFMNSTAKLLEKEFSKDERYYLNKIDLGNEVYSYRFSEIRGCYAKIIQDKSDNLDNYFSFCKLHTFNEMYHNEAVKDNTGTYEKNFFNEIILNIERNKAEIKLNHPNLFIIYLVDMLFESSDEKYLNELLEYLEVYEKKFTINNLRYYYHYITQYYVKKINTGKTDYRRKLFQIYKKMREANLFVIDNVITDLEFNAVVNTSLSLREFEWIEDFIEECKEYLDARTATDALSLAKAKLYFYKKDHKKIFECLNNIDIKDPYYYSHTKFILGRVYFDSGNIEGARYIIDNLRQYLRINNSISKELADTVRTFNHYMSEMLRIVEFKNPKLASQKVIFKKELDNEKKLVSNKDWFYEAVDSL